MAAHEAGHALVAFKKGYQVFEISSQGFTHIAFPSTALSPDHDQAMKHETKPLNELSFKGRSFVEKIEEAFLRYSKPKRKKAEFDYISYSIDIASYERLVREMCSSIIAINKEIVRYNNQNTYGISNYIERHEDYTKFKTVLNENRIIIDDTCLLIDWLKKLPKSHLYFDLELMCLEAHLQILSKSIVVQEHEHVIDELLRNYDGPLQILPCKDVIDVYLGGWAAVEILGYSCSAIGIGDDIEKICTTLGVPEYSRTVAKIVFENYYGQPTTSYGMSREEKLAFQLATAKDNLQYLFMRRSSVRRNLRRLAKTVDKKGIVTGEEAKKLLRHVL